MATTVTKLIPGKIKAANYDKQSGTTLETTTDIDGGKDVGWIDPNDYMDYNVAVLTDGDYTVDVRYSNQFSGTMQIMDATGVVLTTIVLPGTGSFSKWATVTSEAFTLKEGVQTLRIFCVKKFTLNWLNFNIVVAYAQAPFSFMMHNNTGISSITLASGIKINIPADLTIKVTV
jgi:hypothetical protein